MNYLKKTSTQTLLSKSVEISHETSQNSRLVMIESDQQQYHDVQHTFVKDSPSELKKLTSIKTDSPEELINFLGILYTVSCELEESGELILHVTHQMSHSVLNNGGSDEVIKLKTTYFTFFRGNSILIYSTRLQSSLIRDRGRSIYSNTWLIKSISCRYDLSHNIST